MDKARAASFFFCFSKFANQVFRKGDAGGSRARDPAALVGRPGDLGVLQDGAARGGLDGKDYPWGDQAAKPEHARFSTPKGPGPVALYDPNAFGLYDMAGGVSEWCSDWFARTYYEVSAAENPQGPAEGLYKMIRGGAWSDGPKRLTVFFRNWVRPNQRTPNLGFRCAKDAK